MRLSKSKSRRSIRLWDIIGIIVLLLAVLLSVTYTQNQTQDVRSRASGTNIEFIGHTVVLMNGRNMFITVAHPKNIQPGDILVAMLGSDYAHVDVTPTGWKLIRQDIKNKGHIDDLALQSYYRIVTADEKPNYTWNVVTKRDDTPSDHQPLMAVDLYAFRGVDPANPIFSHDVAGETKDPRAIKCPSISGIIGGMLLCSYMGDDPGSIRAPGTMSQTSDFEIAKGDSYAAAYERLITSEKTGFRTAVWNNPGREKNGALKNGSDFAHAIVLRPLQ